MVRIELGNELEEMTKVMTALAEFSADVGLDKGVAQAAELVLDELLNNVINHAYLDAKHHTIVVDMSIAEQALQIIISDDGIPFNPFAHKDPDLKSSLEEREVGGVGLFLVKKFMDECSYERLEDRNIVTLVKYLAASRRLPGVPY